MPRDNVPSDLIQEVVDILAGDNNHVEIYIQGTPNGGVLVLTGDVIRLDGDNFLYLSNIRIQGAYGEPAEFPIHLSSVIQIKTIGA